MNKLMEKKNYPNMRNNNCQKKKSASEINFEFYIIVLNYYKYKTFFK